MRISAVPVDHIDSVWAIVEPFLARAVPYSKGRFVTKDFYYRLKRGEWQLWIMFDDTGIFAAATTGISEYPQRRVLVCQMCGGDRMNQWIRPFHSILENFARDCECDGLELVGRGGWKRWLEPLGFEDTYHVFTAPVKRTVN